MVKKFTFRRPDDFHCHFRKGDMQKLVLPFTAKCFARGIAMPNTRPRAILTAKDVVAYYDEIMSNLDVINPRPDFKPLMTIEIRDNTTPDMVLNAYKAGAVAGKVYPLGTTTNSDEGLRDFFNREIIKTFRAMEDVGMLLLIHGELAGPRTLVTKREDVFLPTLEKLTKFVPDLKIVLEHISTRKAVCMVKDLGKNVAATVTLHHLLLTLNDCIGDGIRPHNIWMPIPKDFPDRRALILEVLSGNSKFFFGSDTAPHAKQNKECAKGACGGFSAPVLLPRLIQFFKEANKLDKLEDFTSRFGAEFYGLPLNEGTVTFIEKEWTVPESYGKEPLSVEPFLARQILSYQQAV